MTSSWTAHPLPASPGQLLTLGASLLRLRITVAPGRTSPTGVASLPMRAEVLKGHLDGLLLATLEARPRHGYAVMEALRPAAAAGSTCRPARSIRPSTGWSVPGLSWLPGWGCSPPAHWSGRRGGEAADRSGDGAHRGRLGGGALCCRRLLLLAGLVAWATTPGGLAWPLAVLAAAASATRLTLAGRYVLP
jgi:hypothetical protein